MDPAFDPLVVAQSAPVIPTASAVNFSAVQTTVHNHPSYAEMISAAIAALNEPEGSSKRAISKYIESHYSDLPPNHSALLTHHLKQLKFNGQLVMFKKSYKLPGSGSARAPVNGAANVESAENPSAVVKRRPGRPPKPKPDTVQAAVPVFPQINMNDVPVAPSENVAILPETTHITAGDPVNGGAAVTPRGRGRPPKLGGVKRGPGRPRIGGTVAAGSTGRSRGRPRKNAVAVNAAAPAAGRRKGPGRPMGRPPKPINIVEVFAPAANLGDGEIGAAPIGVVEPPVAAPVGVKRRGRPPKAGNEAKRARNIYAAVPKPPRKLSGKPVGRPRKDAQARSSDSQLLVAYLDLKAKLENLQSMVKQTAALVRPSLNSEAAINAINELELAVVNASGAPSVQPAQQPLQEQVQPQH